MGQLDEPAFEAHLAPCSACGGRTFELRSYIDQRIPVMLGEAAGPPRWVHDGEKFVDGTYHIACAGCARVVFTSADCPRCHAGGGLARATGSPSRLVIPRRCTSCRGTELAVTVMLPARATHGGGPTRPVALLELGDDGVHATVVECEDCGVIAEADDACPLCAAPGPLRPRP